MIKRTDILLTSWPHASKPRQIGNIGKGDHVSSVFVLKGGYMVNWIAQVCILDMSLVAPNLSLSKLWKGEENRTKVMQFYGK